MHVRAIHRVSDERSFDGLEQEWPSLVGASRAPSVFLTWEWVRTWWTVFGEEKELFVITFRDDESRLCGIAPLYRTRRGFGPFGVNELRFIGFGEDVKPDYLGLIARAGTEDQIAAALCRYLEDAAGEWDTVRLTDIVGDMPYLESVARYYEARGCRIGLETSATCRYVSLPHSYDDYLTTLGRNLRYNIARRTKTLLKGFDAELFVWEEPSTVAEGIDELARLHRKRWAGRRGSRSFSSDRYLRFHRAVAREFLEKGWLRLYGLRIEGRIVAALYCYHYMGKVYYYQSGFDPDWYRYSTGLVLCAFALRRAIEEGAQEFDFLRGDHSYKEAWSQSSRTTRTLYLAKPAIPSRLDYTLSVGVPLVKRRLKSIWTKAWA